MLNSKSFLAVDFGAGSLKLAEFEINEAGGLRLKQYGIRPLGPEGAQESAREALILKVLQEQILEKQIKAKTVNVCAPGFHVFSKFVKLPPVDSGKVTQIIQYEAQQNVPFPLAEVVWDYQILGTTPSGEMEVLLVAIKSDIVEGLFRVAETAGLSLQVADVSAAALCNAFRYNYSEVEECTMLLDIGAKTSNLLFFEKGKVFARGINLGANSITQDFVNESKMKFDMAEKLKIAEGFVSLGGAYEEPENPQQAAIAKIARQFMTRLHIQVNQTMQFYRGQQGGSAPQRLFLAGGASIMPYTAQFFAEKLNVPVEYFNPFRNVQIDPAINLEDLAKVAHAMGEVVGLGLRNLATCPVELNLMPESTVRWQTFNQKKPYFIATVFCLVVVIAAVGFLFKQLAGVQAKDLETVTADVTPLQNREQQFKRAYADLKKLKDDAAQITAWMEQRYFWADVMKELRRVFITVEDNTRRRIGADVGVWAEQFITAGRRSDASALPEGGIAPGPAGPPVAGPDPEVMAAFRRRYGMDMMGGRGPAPAPTEQPPGMPPAEGAPAPGTEGAAPAEPQNTNEVAKVTLFCRGVDLTRVSAAANTELAFAVLKELQTCPWFDAEGTKFDDRPLLVDEQTGTFTFGITLKLKRPLKLF
ncbi:MAG TPA: type IV pilus assembly protein PilM [Verrucomicrobiae bacterium]